jgi:hypothetical protein
MLLIGPPAIDLRIGAAAKALGTDIDTNRPTSTIRERWL